MKTEHRKDNISWDECFMRIAHIIADRSKDPSTQVGAVITTTDNIVVGLGYNGFPRGVNDDSLPWDRDPNLPLHETKYAYICHAEENAVYNANGIVRGGKIYCTLFPCNECAKTLVQNGIKEIIYEGDKYNHTPACIAAKKLFDAAGVAVRQYICEKK